MKSAYKGVRFQILPSGEAVPHPNYKSYLSTLSPGDRFFEQRIWLRDNDRQEGIHMGAQDLSLLRSRINQYFN